MGSRIQLAGKPSVGFTDEARIEAVIPISGADTAWRAAFEDALPPRKNPGQVRAYCDAITIVVANRAQLKKCLDDVAEAVRDATRTGRLKPARITRAVAHCGGLWGRPRGCPCAPCPRRLGRRGRGLNALTTQ